MWSIHKWHSMYVCAKLLQSCPTFCDPMGCRLPDSPVHGILQSRILKWVTMPSSRGSSQSRHWTSIFLCLLHWQVGSLPFTSLEKPKWCTAATAAKLLQSCLILCNPIDSSLPGSLVRGILQARVLEWVAISFSNARKRKVKVKSLSHVGLLATPWTAAH